VGGSEVFSAVVSQETKIVFRSRSSKLILFFQYETPSLYAKNRMSKEMWEYASDGLLYFERAMNVFFPALVGSWKKIGASHSVTIIMTSRSYFDNIPARKKGTGIHYHLSLSSFRPKYFFLPL
jgi:hypothetical protein